MSSPHPCLTRTGRSGSTGIMSCHSSFPRTEARFLSPTKRAVPMSYIEHVLTLGA